MSIPYGSAASAYTLDFADEDDVDVDVEEEGAEVEEEMGEREEEREEEEGGWRVIRGDWDVRVGSQSLIVRSKEPEAIHWRSRLRRRVSRLVRAVDAMWGGCGGCVQV